MYANEFKYFDERVRELEWQTGRERLRCIWSEKKRLRQAKTRINECTNTKIIDKKLKCKLLLDDYNGQSVFIHWEREGKVGLGLGMSEWMNEKKKNAMDRMETDNWNAKNKTTKTATQSYKSATRCHWVGRNINSVELQFSKNEIENAAISVHSTQQSELRTHTHRGIEIKRIFIKNTF